MLKSSNLFGAFFAGISLPTTLIQLCSILLFEKSHKIEKVVEAEVTSKNETIELFNNRNGWLKYQMEEKWREIATINKELEFQLIQKEKKICDLENKLVVILFLIFAQFQENL